MAPPTKRVRFRGEQRTVAEIADILDLPRMTVYSRLFHGRELGAPKHDPKLYRSADAMCDDDVRYERDLESRVARIVCGGSCTLDQLAALWDVSHQMIAEIEQRAFRKIRNRSAFSRDAREFLRALEEARDEPRVPARRYGFRPGEPNVVARRSA